MRWGLGWGLLLAGLVQAEVIPPAPAHYFNDQAHVVSTTTAQALDQELKQFERDTSNQIVVAVFPKMESESSIEDYTVRVAQAWGVGQKDRKNGAVLFVFVQDRKMYLQVGYGLEGALPDILCKQIIENEIKPRFRQNDFDGGLRAGVQAILQATRGEYQGTQTVGDANKNSAIPVIIFFLIILFLFIRALNRRGTVYDSRGRRIYTSSSSWSDGGWSGGGGGGGGFSGGGGSFGGGGAGGSW
jgi:uncharacterized protein